MKEKKASKETQQVSLNESELKELLFDKLKKSEFEAADSISNLVTNDSGNFFLLMKAISTLGVDSVMEAAKEFKQLQGNEPNDCFTIVAKQFQDLLQDKTVEENFRKMYVENVIKELEQNSVVNLCEKLRTPSTYDVEIE